MTDKNDHFHERDGTGITRRRALQGAGGALAAASLAGCMGVRGAPPSTLRYAQVLPPVDLDPVLVDDAWSAQASARIFQGLYRYDQTASIVPGLATGEPDVSEDGTRYTVTIQDGARFQNGDPVTAQDVAYTFRAAANRTEEEGDALPPDAVPANQWRVDMIESITPEDERTVRFDLSHPYPAFDHSLTLGVVPEAERKPNPEHFNEQPVGSGPFEPGSVTLGKFATLERWQDYWGDTQPTVDRATFIHEHSGLARTMSMRTNQNEIVERIEPKLWETTEGFPHTHIETAKSFHTHYVGFNCSKGPTADPKVREAVDYLVDMDRAVEHFVGETGRRQHGVLPPQVAEAWGMPTEEWKTFSHGANTKKAKQLFDEAAISGWRPKIAVPKDLLREKFAEEIAHGLSKVGFRSAQVKKYHWPEFRRKLVKEKGKYDMWIGAWSGGTDPDTYLYPLFHENNRGVTNAAHYRNPKLMEEIGRARKTTDRDERRDRYERAIRTILEENVHLPAFTLDNTFGVADRVRGFDAHPMSGANPRLADDEPIEIS